MCHTYLDALYFTAYHLVQDTFKVIFVNDDIGNGTLLIIHNFTHSYIQFSMDGNGHKQLKEHSAQNMWRQQRQLQMLVATATALT